MVFSIAIAPEGSTIQSKKVRAIYAASNLMLGFIKDSVIKSLKLKNKLQTLPHKSSILALYGISLASSNKITNNDIFTPRGKLLFKKGTPYKLITVPEGVELTEIRTIDGTYYLLSAFNIPNSHILLPSELSQTASFHLTLTQTEQNIAFFQDNDSLVFIRDINGNRK